MSVQKIHTFPDPILREKTEPVTTFDQALKELVADMAETMYAAPGVGLAANQIGVCRKVVLVDATRDKEKNGKREYLVFINPEIIDAEGSQVDEEGCLSVLQLTANVKRFRKILVRALDLAGKPFELEAEDYFARIIQHELDHLNGILFIDHLSALKRTLYKRRLKKILEEDQDASHAE